MKKLTAILFTLLLVLGLAACGTDKPEVPDDTTPAETDPLPVEKETVTIFKRNERPAFRIVYGKECHFRISSMANKMMDVLETEMGVSANKRDDSKAEETYEILLGDTSREESAKALEGVADNEFIVTFNGEKLVINSKEPYGVQCAVRRFIDAYIRGKDECALPTDFVWKEVYELPEEIRIIDGLKRGINLETVSYERTLQRDASVFQLLADSGFDHIRFPMNFDLFWDENGKLDEEKMQAVDQAIQYSLDAGLPIFLDLHYIECELDENDNLLPASVDKILSIWQQLSDRYHDYPAGLCYEILNEPCMNDWNDLQRKAYDLIRANEPTRIILLASEDSTIQDDYIVLDYHDYSPHYFTHQGIGDSHPDYTPYSESVFKTFTEVLDEWVKERAVNGTQIVVGEFSVSPYRVTDEEVGHFLSDVTAYMEKVHLPWTYWEFDNFWAAYDHSTESWKDPRYGGLMGKYPLYMKEGD